MKETKIFIRSQIKPILVFTLLFSGCVGTVSNQFNVPTGLNGDSESGGVCTLDGLGITEYSYCGSTTLSDEFGGGVGCLTAYTPTATIALGADAVAIDTISVATATDFSAGTLSLGGADAASFRLTPIQNTFKDGNNLKFVASNTAPAKFAITKVANFTSAQSTTLTYTYADGTTNTSAITAAITDTNLLSWHNASEITYADIIVADDLDTSGTLSEGDRISSWPDLLGLADVVQATDGNKPIYREDPLGKGYGGLFFDGNTDVMATAANVAALDFAHTQPATIFVVAMGFWGGVGGFDGAIIGTRNATGSNGTVPGWQIMYMGTSIGLQGGPIYRIKDSVVNGTRIWVGGTDTANAGGAMILIGDNSGTGLGTGLDFWVNGRQENNDQGTFGAVTNAISGNSFAIGAAPNGSANFRGLINEVIIFDEELSDARRELYECYLAGKWGVQAAVDLNCP